MARTANTSAERSTLSPPRPPPVAHAGGWPSPPMPPPLAAAAADDDDDNREIAARDLPPSPPPTPPPNEATADAFLLSMTFASGGFLGRCDCSDSDCEVSGGGVDDRDPLPRDVRDAVDRHNARKRRGAEEGEEERRQRRRDVHPLSSSSSTRLAIRQERTLVRREGGFALWRLALPPGDGDPIVEYRNNHRVLFVERLDGVSGPRRTDPAWFVCRVRSFVFGVSPDNGASPFHSRRYARRVYL